MTVILSNYAIGSLFHYEASTDWCRDGQAELRETPSGERYLVDTYWMSGTDNDRLSAAETATAGFYFDPSMHREVRVYDIDIYPAGVVTTILRQHGCYRKHYVPAGQPELTLLDRTRHEAAKAERELEEAVAEVERKNRHAEHMRRELARLEAEAA